MIAELPPKLIEGGIATPGLLTEIVIGKYCDHLPLYRKRRIILTHLRGVGDDGGPQQRRELRRR